MRERDERVRAVLGDEEGMSFLREQFPDGTADPMNFVLFSTSGIHGSYMSMEEAWLDRKAITKAYGEPHTPSVTFLVVRPRITALLYGNALMSSDDDLAFLQRLRASSHEVVARIGAPSRFKADR